MENLFQNSLALILKKLLPVLNVLMTGGFLHFFLTATLDFSLIDLTENTLRVRLMLFEEFINL